MLDISVSKFTIRLASNFIAALILAPIVILRPHIGSRLFKEWPIAHNHYKNNNVCVPMLVPLTHIELKM